MPENDLATLTHAVVEAAWRRGLEPEAQLTVSQWADKHRMLPSTSAEPGAWETDRVPYLRDIMDCLSVASPVERVVFMKGAQLGGTEAGLNWIGYVIAHAPGTMLLVMPSLDMLKRNSRTRIDPLIASSPVLRERVAAPKARDKGNTIALKEFDGGQLVMTGANAPSGLRSTPVRYLFLDEVDGYPLDADGEGDPVALAIQRTATYRGRRKIFLCSTPTIAGVSRIEKAFEESDQRKFFVPCPQCGAFQLITWAHIKWDDDRAAAHMQCQHCSERIDDHEKPAMLAQGEWRCTAAGDGRTAGFHLSALYSPFETWGEIALEHGRVKHDPPRLQAWVNTKLGEAWEDEATAPVIAEVLAARAQDWGSSLPPQVSVITAGVDTQDDRLEVELVGWGAGEESWSLAYEVVWGDPARPEAWEQLDRILTQRFARGDGLPPLGIAAAAVDSGGHRTPEVMRYAQARQGRRVWPMKGRGGPGVPPWPKRPPKPSAARLSPVFIVGVDGIKTALLARLRIEAPAPGFVHVPTERDLDWYRGVTAERPIRRYVKGVPRIEWLKDSGVRNEPLDCRVYATAALHGLYAAGFKFAPAENRAGVQQAPKVVKSQWMG
jgi:phage terminase large subunit GpA-like protein